jgi:DNA invertase Pin-like site-specific DNA recombinase
LPTAAGKIKTVVTKDPDRLSRDTSQLIALLLIFWKAGVRVEFSTRQGKDRYAFFNVVLSAVTELDEARASSNHSRGKHK